jgi:hypothetical protein
MNALSSKNVKLQVLCAGAALCVSAALALAQGTSGILTADVEIASPELFGGLAFPAVINPDAMYPGAVQGVNMSGVFLGSAERPDRFIYTDLPVYAITDGSGNPLTYEDPLFAIDGDGDDDFASPLFELSLVGMLSLDFVLESDRFYRVDSGSFRHDTSGSLVMLSGGTVFFEPFGSPDFLWYGIGGLGLDLYDNFGMFGMLGNDDLWSSGWPGATLDKNFFPVPGPGSITALGIGLIIGQRRRG